MTYLVNTLRICVQGGGHMFVCRNGDECGIKLGGQVGESKKIVLTSVIGEGGCFSPNMVQNQC